MQSHRYVGFFGSLIFIALIFIEVYYQSIFSSIWFYFIGAILGYLSIYSVFYALGVEWKQASKQALTFIVIAAVIGLIIKLLRNI